MGGARQVLEQAIDAWNGHDREGWTGLFSDAATLSAPGEITGSGSEATAMFFSIWQDAFPDCQVSVATIVEEGDEAVLEAVFQGTHTAPLRPPGAEFPATGKRVSIPFVNMNSVRDGRFTSFRLYFDQLDLLNQLGLSGAESPG